MVAFSGQACAVVLTINILVFTFQGHISRDCPQPQRRACYTCGSEGCVVPCEFYPRLLNGTLTDTSLATALVLVQRVFNGCAHATSRSLSLHHSILSFLVLLVCKCASLLIYFPLPLSPLCSVSCSPRPVYFLFHDLAISPIFLMSHLACRV